MSELIFFSLTSIPLIILNLSDLVVYWFQKPPDTIYIGITHWYEDFFYYLSQFAQGARGDWLSKNMFTSENIPANFNWVLNVLLGKIGALFGLSPWTSYHASLVLFSLVYLVLVYRVIRNLFPNDRMLAWGAYLLALVAGGPVTFFYSYTTPLNRLGGVPHLIAQNILVLIVLMVFSSILGSNKIHKKKSLLLAAAIGALFIINPVYALTSLTTILVTSLFYRPGRLLATLGLIAIVLGPLLVYQIRVFSHPFYQYFRILEASMPPVDASTLIRSYGLIIFLAAFGLPFFLKQKTPLGILGVIYTIGPIIAYYLGVPKYLSLPYFRFLQPPAYVFLASFAALGIYKLSVGKRSLYIIIFAAILASQLPLLWYEARQKRMQYYLNSHLNYVKVSLYEGLRALGSMPDRGIVLATGTLELFVPFTSGKTVYAAHRSLTYNYTIKIKQVQEFYAIKMSKETAQEFLRTNRIAYVLWQKELGDPQLLTKAYPFLYRIFENGALVIFTL